MAPGTATTIALSTISITPMLKRVGRQRDRHDGRQREAGAQQRQARERVAEEEGEGDREGHRPPLREPQRGADHHAGDLADGAAGEAVQRGAEGDGVERAP